MTDPSDNTQRPPASGAPTERRPAATDARAVLAGWRWHGPPLGVLERERERGVVPSGGSGSPPAGILFLDRDGTLIADAHYLDDPADVVLVPAAMAAMQLARSRRYATVLVTNQSGVARERFPVDRVEAVQQRIDERLAEEGFALDLVLACPCHPHGTHPRFGRTAGVVQGRKPGTGMLELGARLLGVPLAPTNCLLVGDTEADGQAARAAGIAGVRVPTHWHDRVPLALQLERPEPPDSSAVGWSAALSWLAPQRES